MGLEQARKDWNLYFMNVLFEFEIDPLKPKGEIFMRAHGLGFRGSYETKIVPP